VKKLLLVTYHFPPDAEVGGVRPYQLARHLPGLGYDTHVLTVDPAFAESPDPDYRPDGVPLDRIVRTGVETTLRDRVLRAWRVKSSVLLADDPAREDGGLPTPVQPRAGRPRGRLRSWTLEWLAFPCLRYGWHEPALRAGDQLLATQRFDAILSTSPPRVAHMVASRLSRGHGIPWIMDLRDPWYDAESAPRAVAGVRPRLYGLLFARHARQAALLVANTERHRRHLEESLGIDARRTACVPNGLDPASASQPGSETRATSFSIGHFGQMPGRRSAASFLEGLKRWLDRRPVAAGRVTARFVGSGFDEARRMSDSLRLGNVSFEPRVARAEVSGLMADQYVLLVLANDQPLQVPGKAYEYLAALRRILACTERDSATADVLSSAPGCAIAEDPEGVASALERWWSEHSGGAGARVERSALLASMTHLRRAEQFAELLGEVTGR
jgi:glycosyltransferase involved in cell wall biosynthesis